jgi:hypothetical protein
VSIAVTPTPVAYTLQWFENCTQGSRLRSDRWSIAQSSNRAEKPVTLPVPQSNIPAATAAIPTVGHPGGTSSRRAIQPRGLPRLTDFGSAGSNARPQSGHLHTSAGSPRRE